MDWLEKIREDRKLDAKKFEGLDEDLCMLCLAQGQDKRSLIIDCFYDIKEVVPEAIDLSEVKDSIFEGLGFYLRICKTCRSMLLTHLGKWGEECKARRILEKDHDGESLHDYPEEATIPIMKNGIVVMLTEDQYAEYKGKKDEQKS